MNRAAKSDNGTVRRNLSRPSRRVKDFWLCEDSLGALYVLNEPPDLLHKALHLIEFEGLSNWIKMAQRLAEAASVAEWHQLAQVPGGVGICIADYECQELRDALEEFREMMAALEKLR